MTPLAWWLIGGVIWAVGAVALAVVIGRTARNRDRQRPTPPTSEEVSVTDHAARAVMRHTAIADRLATELDRSGMSVTVQFHDARITPTFSLVELAKVLDRAGLVDDTKLGDPS